ncbi:hypothetical protein [Aeromicrobium sp.]|uniref:hypothetical protein n=1 Tax=Aeromicrobium sp. TaxID=1871063 RepID=UPI002FCBBCBA
MQPNKSTTPWGAVAWLVTLAAALAAAVMGIVLLTLIPSSGFTMGDSLEEQMCIIAPTGDEMFEYENSFGKTTSDGVRTATAERAYCKPYDEFEHPYAARVLDQVSGTIRLIAFVGSMMVLRRIIKQTWENGPFHQDTVRRLSRFRWWATGAIGIALIGDWVLNGIELQLLTDEMWPGPSFVEHTVFVLLALTAVVMVCDFGSRQRHEAWEQGRTQGPDDGRV